MTENTWPPDFRWSTLVAPVGAEPAAFGSPEDLPGANATALYNAIACAAAVPAGDIVLSHLDPRAAAAASRSAADDATIFFVHSDLAHLRSAFQLLSRSGLDQPIIFFHGHLRELLREIPVRPMLAATADSAGIIDLWDALPARALLIVAGPFPASASWQRDGYLEPVHATPGYASFETTARFPFHPPTRFPARLRRQVRASLLARYFSRDAQPGATYTPVSDLTVDAREWWRDSSNNNAGGYAGWPFRIQPSLRLPDTLPNGERWPLISIVTPTYNQGQYIEETILSVKHQSYPRIEHIIMDGGSKDQTVAIMNRYRDSLAAAVSEKDRGQAHAINKGMALATGDILTWLNSDDMLAPGALASIAMGFHLSQADLVAGIVYLRSNNQFVDSHLTCCPPGPLPLDRILDLDGGWNAGQFFYQPEVMFSRDAWERAGATVREDLYYSMDYDLWVRMAEAGARLHVIGRPIAWFRVHDEQKTSVAEKFMAELRGYVDDYNAKHQRTPSPAPASRPTRRQLRILMLNDHGYKFGAGIAHRRTAHSLALAGHDVRAAAFLPEPGHHGRPSDLSSTDVRNAVDAVNPDIVITGNIHSATQEPWHLGVIAEKHPTLSVLHDFWLLTGRCAYPNPCGKNLTGCDASCPTAGNYPKLAPNLIAPTFAQKQKLLFSQTHLALLGNSSWTCREAERFLTATGAGRPHVPVVPFRLSFPVDTFVPLDRPTARRRLGLPEDRFIVLLSGDLYDERKNTPLALRAVENLQLPNLTIVSLGYVKPGESFSFDVRRPGHLTDPALIASYYAAADVLVAPSAEETFGQVFLEASACGTPVIGIRGSGMQEAVVDGVTGILVDECSTSAIGAAVLELYRRPRLREAMGAWGRIWAENEWSPEAAYYHMFQAWRRLGLLDQLGVQPKIAFRMSPVDVPEPRLINSSTGATLADHSMGFEEGPFPEYNLPVFRWAYGPVSRLKLNVPTAGAYSFVLKYRNLHEGQRVTVRLDGGEVGTFSLPVTGIKKGRMLCAPAAVHASECEIELEFARWMDPNVEGRPLAIVVTDVILLPEVKRAAAVS